MSKQASIENLLNPTGDEESVAGVFAKKQKEIKIKEGERKAQRDADSLGIDYINLVGFPISPEALGLIPEETAKELKVVCFFYDGKNIRLGCLNPTQAVQDQAENMANKYFADAKIYLISENSLSYALDVYRAVPKIIKYDAGVEIKPAQLKKFQDDLENYKNLNEKINEVNVSDIITLMLAAAIKVKASDIHIEAEEKGVVIRLRIDGVLQEAAIIESRKWEKIISRLKILAGVKINIENKPQDGRFTIFLENHKIDVRCSFLPTAFGESVVMRLLDSKATALDIDNLGIRPEVLPILKKEISKPNGLILTTGPTGSGKTTTLYAVLNRLNKPGVKIITLEDPIEYQLPGINQSQVDSKHDFSFAEGLRSVLRQDPNVVMVGEIRDLETAEIAIQASLTGHLVLSTLHTNDASGVIPRMIDLGVKPYFLAPSVNAVIGQRLVRQLCPHCRREQILKNDEEELIHKILAVMSPKSGVDTPTTLPQIYQASPDGCKHCNFTGYKGRIGIFEIFTVSDNIRQLTIDRAPSFKILQQAIENGMITMLQDGILKVLAGHTSLDEIYRVIGNFDYVHELYDIVISQTIGRGIKISESEMVLIDEVSKDISKTQEKIQDIPVSQLIKLTMGLAVRSEAGDIHIEPTENDVKIRFRIDGIMHDVASLPKTSYLPLLSEIKILAGTPTNVKKATFDGRFSVYLPENRKVDCRLSIISGGYGESIVIRVLSSSATKLEMEKLGVTSVALESMNRAMKKNKGIIITTGPTGSGKTTTLYSMLNQLNKPDIKIITVEDPIEYQLPGIMQTQIDEAQGYTFASAMRSLLRQNPNIMMIGEIRDEETAKIAIEASTTGHLVLSTIHANSAAGAISRFSGLGVDRQALANSLEFSIGQRLVRRICPHCKQTHDVSPEDLNKVKEELDKIKNPAIKIPEKLTFYKGVGCEQCGQLGYKGRLGLYETIEMTPSIRQIIQGDKITDYQIEEEAIKNGMITMLQDGILKALAGETTLEEVFRVS
jgi:type IV pilus assembly protein PilB